MSNHRAATAPNTRFTDLVVVSIVLPHGFAALTDRDYRRHSGGEDTTGGIDDPRVYRLRLTDDKHQYHACPPATPPCLFLLAKIRSQHS
jgi:hypothetical protein